MEGGHSGAGDAILDDVRDLRIGKALDFWVLGDVGSAFTASAVEAVAIGAGRGKSLLAASGDWLDGFRLGVLPGCAWAAKPLVITEATTSGSTKSDLGIKSIEKKQSSRTPLIGWTEHVETRQPPHFHLMKLAAEF